MNGPNLIACIITSTSEATCNNSIELGKLYINAGDNRYLVKDTDLNAYNTIVIYDKTTQSSFATIPLRDYGVLRISGESFLDWIQYDFAIIPLLAVILIIFPIMFDYTRSVFKISFFAVYLIVRKPKWNKPLNDLSPIMFGKKITAIAWRRRTTTPGRRRTRSKRNG
jgi:hypothetical protein